MKKMIQFKIYLYKKCARAKQEGVITMLSPKAKEEMHFDYLDQIPGKMRDLLKSEGLFFDVTTEENSLAETVIVPKTRRVRS